MIKTEQLTKHQICCTKCGGSLKLKREAINEFEMLLDEQPVRVSTVSCRGYVRPEVPTCTNCGKKFQVEFDSQNMTITLKDYK